MNRSTNEIVQILCSQLWLVSFVSRQVDDASDARNMIAMHSLRRQPHQHTRLDDDNNDNDGGDVPATIRSSTKAKSPRRAAAGLSSTRSQLMGDLSYGGGEGPSTDETVPSVALEHDANGDAPLALGKQRRKKKSKKAKKPGDVEMKESLL